MRALGLLLIALVLVAPVPTPAAHVRPATFSHDPFTLTAVYPLPNVTIDTTTPTIEATFTDRVSSVPYGGVDIVVDGRDVSGFQGVNITPSSVSYAVGGLFPLTEGANNVTITLIDNLNNSAQFGWNFTVNTSLAGGAQSSPPIRLQTLLLYMGIGAGVAAAAFGGWILYLKQTSRFAFRKYFITHPVQRSYLVLYIPIAAAFVFLLVAADWIAGTPSLPAMAYDYVFVAVIFIALTPFAIDSRRHLNELRTYERAFSQFLFEMADAMRGGIDPAKAIVEFSKTSANVLRRHLRIAADSVRIGRPFETVLRDMVRPMKSPLIRRYAELIADASGVGGETSLVVYRAAKDMDDFVKIEEEREKQLSLPVAVIYISNAVLIAVLFVLLYIAPSLGHLSINFGALGGATSGGSPLSQVQVIDAATLHQRFYELMLTNSLGTGAIIGAFTEGRARYGLLHSLAMVGTVTIAFTLFVV